MVKFNYIKSHKEKGVTCFNASRPLFKNTGTWARAMGYAGFDTRVFVFITLNKTSKNLFNSLLLCFVIRSLFGKE